MIDTKIHKAYRLLKEESMEKAIEVKAYGELLKCLGCLARLYTTM